jgi:hypothetical protein
MFGRAKQTHFYATYDDIAEVLQLFEAEGHVLYVQTGLFDSDTPQIFETFRAINSLSVSVDGDANLVPGYLIVNERHHIAVEKVPQRVGGLKYAIDQGVIPDSLYFQSGGVLSDKIIVPGRIGILRQTAISTNLYNSFARIMKKDFNKVKSYYVGRQAHTLWREGMRLGISLKASTDIDLK